MSVFAAYVREHGEDAVADELTEKLGRPITPAGVKSRRRKPPESWVESLGLEETPSPSAADLSPGDGEGTPSLDAESTSRQSEVPPKAPTGSRFVPSTPPPGALEASARDRIAKLHVFAGASLASAVDPEGLNSDTGVGGGIGLLWTDKAEPIADAWIAWAQEGNKFAQSFVKLMATGGAGGELVFGYAMLLGGTAYIMGHMPANAATEFAFGRYTKYRTVPVVPSGNAADNGRPDGTFDPSAIDSLGDTPEPFSP